MIYQLDLTPLSPFTSLFVSRATVSAADRANPFHYRESMAIGADCVLGPRMVEGVPE